MSQKEETKSRYEKERSLAWRKAQIKAGIKNIGKSGSNKYAGFSYHELKDFLPKVNELQAEYGVDDELQFFKEEGYVLLTLINTDNPEDTSSTRIPYEDAEMLSKGGGASSVDAVQRLGSTITYLRRYIYMTAYNISEDDSVDASSGKSSDDKNRPPRKLTPTKTKPKSVSKTTTTPQTKSKTTSKPEQQPSASSQVKDKATNPQIKMLEKFQESGKLDKEYNFATKKGLVYEDIKISKSEASSLIDEVKKGNNPTWSQPEAPKQEKKEQQEEVDLSDQPF